MSLGISPSEIVGKGTYQLLCRASHWGRIPLSQVADVQNGFAFKSAYFDRENGVPLIRIRDIQRSHTEHHYFGEYDKRYKVRSGDILVGMDGDFTAARWKGEEGLLNQRVCRIQIQNNLFDGRFLFLCLQPYLNAINAETSSVTVKHLSSKTIETIPLPLPPLNEQVRIVAKIEELFSELGKSVENLEKAREQLKVYRQAVLKHAFEGKLTAQWRTRNVDQLQSSATLVSRIRQEREAQQHQQLTDWQAAVGQWEAKGKEGKKPRKPKHLKSFVNLTDGEIGSLARLPSSWLWLLAESVGTIQLGRQRSPRNRSKDYPTKYIRAANITEKGLDLDDVLDMEFGPHELSAYRLEKGDLVLSEASGSAAQVGKPAIWDDQIPNCCFQNTVIRHQPYCRDHSIYLLWLYRFYFISGTFARVADIERQGINHLSAV